MAENARKIVMARITKRKKRGGVGEKWRREREKIFSSPLCTHACAGKGRKEWEKSLCRCASPRMSPCSRISFAREIETQRDCRRERERSKLEREKERGGERRKKERGRKFSPPHMHMHARARRHERGEGEQNREISRERESNHEREGVLIAPHLMIEAISIVSRCEERERKNRREKGERRAWEREERGSSRQKVKNVCNRKISVTRW